MIVNNEILFYLESTIQKIFKSPKSNVIQLHLYFSYFASILIAADVLENT